MLRATAALLLVSTPLWADPLPSWHEGDTKTAIIDFVEATTDPDSPEYVPPENRIATFDNDGTLWSEQPLYFQFFFVLDRARELAAADPAWASTPVLKAAAAGDVPAILKGGKPALVELLGATGGDMTVEAFQADAAEWLATAEHPEKHRPFISMVYQPMIELLDLPARRRLRDLHRLRRRHRVHPRLRRGNLRHAAGAGGRLRGQLEFQMVEGAPQVMREAGVAFVDDGPGKPVGIARHIGQRPVFVAGNSDGDLEMLQWGTAGDGAAHGRHRPPHRRRARMGLRPRTRTSAGSTRRSTRRRPRDGS